VLRCPDDEALADFLAGVASDAVAREVEAHIDECSDCRSVLAESARCATKAPTSPPLELEEPEPIVRGSLLGRFTVLDLLGAGGMGVVYSAFDPELDRRIAVKLVNGRVGERHSLEREARALARVKSPNVATVYDVGVAGGRVFVAMEYVEGQTLRQWAAQPRPVSEVVRVYADAGRGLAAIHAAGLVHRDFKPDNAVVGADGAVRIVDFGLARAIPGAGTFDGNDASGGLSVGGGTPAYMAPEVVEGASLDARSDQYSFCVALYEALFGVRPTPAPSGGPTWVQGKRPTRRLPGHLRAVLARGLSSVPDQRFDSIEALIAALTRPRLKRRYAAIGLALAVGSVAAVEVAADDPCDAKAQVAAVWSDSVRHRIGQAIADSGIPFAQAQSRIVQRSLERYVSDWSVAYGEVCAASDRETQPAVALEWRSACLNAQRRQLEATLATLDQPDTAVANAAHELVDGLVPPRDCLRDDIAESARSRPTDGAALAALSEVEDGVGTVRRQRQLGRFREALQTVEALGEKASGLGYCAARIEVATLRGQLMGDLGDWRGAVEVLDEAGAEADRCGLDRLRALAWQNRTHLLLLLSELGEAQEWVDRLVALSERVAPGGELYADAVALRALVVGNRGDVDAAIVGLRSALSLREKASGTNSERYRKDLQALGTMMARAGMLDEARRTLERALALTRASVGEEEHPALAEMEFALSVQDLERGQYAEALPPMRASCARLERALGPGSEALAECDHHLGIALLRTGDLEGARIHHERALDSRRRRVGDTHAGVAASLDALASVHFGLGNTERALRLYEEALAVTVDVYGERGWWVADSYGNVAGAHARLGRHAQAVTAYRRALSLSESVRGADYPGTTFLRLNLGSAMVMAGEAAAAVPLLRSAVDAFRRDYGDSHALAPAFATALGAALVESGQTAEAVRQLEAALEHYKRLDEDASTAEVAEAEFYLARALRASGTSPARARSLARSAAKRLEGASGYFDEMRKEIRGFLRGS